MEAGTRESPAGVQALDYFNLSFIGLSEQSYGRAGGPNCGELTTSEATSHRVRDCPRPKDCCSGQPTQSFSRAPGGFLRLNPSRWKALPKSRSPPASLFQVVGPC